MNCFTWPKEDNDCIIPGDQYNEQFNKWQRPIHNGQLRSQTLKDKVNTEEICFKYSGSDKFNGIPREGNPSIPIKYYKDQCRERIIRNGMWDVFSLPDPCNKEKKWDILLHQSRFTFEYVKCHVQSLQKGSEADYYVVRKLTCSGVYLRITLSNTILQKVLALVPLTATVPEIFFAAMTTFIYGYYDTLQETLNHMNILKLKSYPWDNVTDCCAEILVDDELLESARAFKPEHLGYITRTFQDTSDSRFRIWDIHKYKQVTEFIKKLRVCDMGFISQEELIIYEYLVQDPTHEYRNIVY